MNEVENKKETTETTERPEKKKHYCRPLPKARFTPRLKEVTKLLQSSFPKLFTRKPEPKYALKIGIYNDLLPWADKNNIAKDELGKALGFCPCPQGSAPSRRKASPFRDTAPQRSKAISRMLNRSPNSSMHFSMLGICLGGQDLVEIVGGRISPPHSRQH